MLREVLTFSGPPCRTIFDEQTLRLEMDRKTQPRISNYYCRQNGIYNIFFSTGNTCRLWVAVLNVENREKMALRSIGVLRQQHLVIKYYSHERTHIAHLLRRR